MQFTIMIPTLLDRAAKLKELLKYLDKQIAEAGAKKEVEILTLADQREKTVGHKRNVLLEQAKGKFVAFVDDDDWVSPTYIKDILFTISKHPDLDCIGFYGEVFFFQERGGVMIHSVLCPEWTEEPGVYFRPPNHLNPIRRELCQRFKFRDIPFSEDHFWSIDIRNAKVLKKEVFLGHAPLYTYRCRERRGL